MMFGLRSRFDALTRNALSDWLPCCSPRQRPRGPPNTCPRPCKHQRADVSVALCLFAHVQSHYKVTENRGFGKRPEALSLCSDPSVPLKE